MSNDKKNQDNTISPEIQNWIDKYPVLSEKDFYPPEDKRIVKSGLDNISNGDNFADYLEEYYDFYEDEIDDDNYF